MKSLLVLFALSGTFAANAQTFVGTGNILVGIEVTYEERTLSLDSLSTGIDPVTGVPVNLVIPEGSSFGIITDSITSEKVSISLNSETIMTTGDPSVKLNGFSTSSSAGTENSYLFVDQTTGDSVLIPWKVGYAPITLLDVYPARYFPDFVTYTLRNFFEEYPDSSLYSWDQQGYTNLLDKRGIPENPALPYSENGLFFVLDNLTEDSRIQLRGLHDSPQAYNTEEPFKLLLYEDLYPGSYELVVQAHENAPESLTLRYAFSVEKPWWQQEKGLAGYTLLFSVVVGGIVFLVHTGRQKRREKELKWKQQLTEAELKAIRAQLNPHFLFNALNSIQNLVNRSENDKANAYITRLSRLLRNVLSVTEKQFHELKDELDLTRLYLEIEQLRYPFNFEITTSKNVDLHTLVPVMLLQPFAENAVKHGMAGQEEGRIQIQVHSKEQKLEITVSDNGPGLGEEKPGSVGIQLGYDRIRHLNDVYFGEARVEISNREDTSGVAVRIILPLE